MYCDYEIKKNWKRFKEKKNDTQQNEHTQKKRITNMGVSLVFKGAARYNIAVLCLVCNVHSLLHTRIQFKELLHIYKDSWFLHTVDGKKPPSTGHPSIHIGSVSRLDDTRTRTNSSTQIFWFNTFILCLHTHTHTQRWTRAIQLTDRTTVSHRMHRSSWINSGRIVRHTILIMVIATNESTSFSLVFGVTPLLCAYFSFRRVVSSRVMCVCECGIFFYSSHSTETAS